MEGMQDLKLLVAMEHFAEDAFRVKRAYIDACEDLVSGILLGQIVYWHLPSKTSATKLKVVKDGRLWLAKGRNDWWDEIRITPKQFDRAIGVLKDRGFVETRLFKFNGAPTVHISVNAEKVTDLILNEKDFPISPKGENPPILPKGQNGNSPMGKMEIDQTVKSLTESTTKTTSESTKDKSPKRKKRVYELESLEMRMALKFESLIKQNDEKFKIPNVQSWCDHFRLMMEKDGRTQEEIHTAMTFAQTDDFWQSNVLSADKLRKQMSALLIQAKKGPRRASQRVSNSAPKEFSDVW